MCLIVLAWQQRTDMPLVVAANRDEFHARPSTPLAAWEEHPNVVAGRDEEAGGTWLGVSREGRFAAVTNVRDLTRSSSSADLSRGELTANFLKEGGDPADYLAQIAAQSDRYQGFNLLIGDKQTLWYLNGGPKTEAIPLKLSPGIYGLSNASLDVPWPKVERAKSSLLQTLSAQRSGVAHEALRQTVQDRQLANPDALHQQGLTTPIEQRLSAQFIVSPEYGTRCTTTLFCNEQGTTDIEEQRFNALGEMTGASAERIGPD